MTMLLGGDEAESKRSTAASTARDRRGAAAARKARTTIEMRAAMDRRKRAPIASDDLFRREDAVKPLEPPTLRRSESPGWPNALTRAVFRTFDPSDSLHPFVKPEPAIIDGLFPAGEEGISGKDKSQRLIGCFADADTWSDLDGCRREAVLANPQARSWRCEIASIVAGAGDTEGLGEAPGAGAVG